MSRKNNWQRVLVIISVVYTMILAFSVAVGPMFISLDGTNVASSTRTNLGTAILWVGAIGLLLNSFSFICSKNWKIRVGLIIMVILCACVSFLGYFIQWWNG